MKPIRVAIVHPGEMGTSIGAALQGRAVFAGNGRSAATRDRAAADGLDDVGSLERLVEVAEIIISVCPPGSAEDVALQIAALGFSGCYVDANAIAPSTARSIGEIAQAAGARFVDGGVIGPPARREGTTRLWLAGEHAPAVAELFAGSLVDARILDGPIGSASALKMAYAAWTKGSTALLSATVDLAVAEGVSDSLLEEWAVSQPEIARTWTRRIDAARPKAWRFVGEMEEIAASFAACDLPSGFHDAAAEVYRALAQAPRKDDESVESG